MKLLAYIVLSLMTITVYAGATISDVTAQQRYPWNGKVDISYTVSGDIGAKARAEKLCTDLKIFAVDSLTGVEYVATNLTGDVSLADGTHQITWDMTADGYGVVSTSVVFHVACDARPGLYCVIDLSEGQTASSYPVSFLDRIPDGGWTDEYKTQKLVLRLVKAGTNPAGGEMKTDMWVGIFEITKGQYEKIMGTSSFSADLSTCAMGGVPKGAHWSEFLTPLSTKTGINFTLPSRSEWQYACRAETTSEYNNGKNGVANMEVLGWYYGNVAKSKTTPCIVGLYLPNAWGLYDMHGNVAEATREVEASPVSHSYQIFCGGSYGSDSEHRACTSSTVEWRNLDYRGSDEGYRMFGSL